MKANMAIKQCLFSDAFIRRIASLFGQIIIFVNRNHSYQETYRAFCSIFLLPAPSYGKFNGIAC